MVPASVESDGAAVSQNARTFWQTRWHGQTVMAIGLRDPLVGDPVMQQLRASILGCPDPIRIAEGGHTVPEYGEEIARTAVDFFRPGQSSS
jgi:tRNA(adenine34) deaminase